MVSIGQTSPSRESESVEAGKIAGILALEETGI